MLQEEFIKAFPQIEAQFNQPLSQYSYTKTGGKAEILVFPKDPLQLAQLVKWFNDHQVAYMVLGNASNVIIRDGGIKGAVLSLRDMNGLDQEGETLIAQAGHSLIQLAKLAGDLSLTGLEFACGIPGSIGGAVYMNAGAYGGEVKDVIAWVDVITPQGQARRYQNEELDFSYRHSRLQETGEIVTAVAFQLSKGDQQAILDKMAELTHLRQSKQPLEYPSCGSVFKRPPGHFTGQLIQEAGLQGYQIGGAQVSTKHAGFIVNVDKATASDYLKLIAYIQEVIWDKFSVQLVPEVRILGQEPGEESYEG